MSKLSTLFLAFVLLLISGWLAYEMLLSALPPVDDLPARVHGRLVDSGALYTHLDEIPAPVQEATVAVEDERFRSHGGIDLVGIVRSVYNNITRRCLCEGGSTITQQLAKQVYLGGNAGTPRRKFDGILLAIEIERRYSKQDILEFYLNTAYYGHGAYGVGAASRIYWRRPVSQADLAEAAMLAGLPQAPSDYDPLRNPAAARERRGEVLYRLESLGRITSAEAVAARAEPVAGNS